MGVSCYKKEAYNATLHTHVVGFLKTPKCKLPLDKWARHEPELNICIQEIMSHETINPDKCVELELLFEMGHCAGIRNGVKERDSPSDMDFATEALRTC